MNPCFDLLDRAVIDGRADEPVLTEPEMTHARLLEEVAAVAGVLRAVGVEPGHAVGVHTSDDLIAVTVLLAALRIGAEPTTSPAAVCVEDQEGLAHLCWAGGTALDWPAVVKAGRTDPAAAHETTSLASQVPDLHDLATPLRASALLALVLGSPSARP